MVPRRNLPGLLVASLALCCLLPSLLPAQEFVVDEVLAIVDRTPILHSDLVLAELVGLGVGKADDLLDARIRLELQYRDLENSDAVRRLDFDVPARVEALVARSGEREALVAELALAGLDWDDLEALALRMEVAGAWTRQHLLPRIVVSLEDVRSAYRRLIVEPALAQHQQPPPLEKVHDRIRRVVEEEKLNQEIDRWVEQSRERHEVVRYVP